MTQENETQPGGFDPERARKMAADLAGEFRGKLKKAQRWMLAELWIFLAFMLFFALRFLESGTPMEWIAFGVLFLMAYETTVLIKLWYWVVNTKIAIVRELKALRLESGAPVGTAALTPKTFRGIAWWEWLIWIAAWVAIGAGVASTYRGPLVHGGEVGLEEYVDLAADGSATITTKAIAGGAVTPGNGFMPSDRFILRFAAKDVKDAHWYDDQWRELKSEMQDADGQRVYTVYWGHPVLPSESRVYHQVVQRTGVTQEAGGLWTYKGQWRDDWPTAKWKVTVRLPAGAELVSSSPKPYMSGGDGPPPTGHRFVGFDGSIQWDGHSDTPHEHPTWKVQYRLPSGK